MAGAGYKLFNTGDVLTAAQVNTYLQEQTVMVFANSTARTTALSGVLAEGMVSYLQDTNAVEVYNGSAWVGVSGAGDVTEVQAGTGISVASGTGPIPVVTNTMATAIDAEGDLIIGDAADAFQRLAIGSNTHVLTVDTSVDGKIKWAAPAGGGGGMTSLASGTLSTGSGTLSLTSISADYKNLQLVVRDCYPASGAGSLLTIQVNSITDYDIITIGTDSTNLAGFYQNASSRHKCYYNGLATNSNDQNTLVVDFYDYADTTSSKLIVSRMHYNSSLPITGEIAITTGFASMTAAISSITLALNSGNFGEAGTYVLYGVK